MTALRVLPPRTTSAPSSRSRWSIDLIERLQDAGAVYARRRRPLLLGHRRPGLRRGVRLRPRGRCCAIFAERGGDPDRRQEGPARLPRLARPSAPGEPAWDSPFGPGRPGWHIECTAIALRPPRRRRSTSRAAAATWSSRTTRCAPAEAQVADPGRAFAQAYVHAGMVGLRRREDVEVPGQPGLRLARCATATSTRWRSGWPCCATTTAATGSGPTPSCWDAVDTLADWRRALALGAGAPAAPVVDEVLAALADDLDAPRAVAAVEAWVDATLGTDGLADTSDPSAATIRRSSTPRWAAL